MAELEARMVTAEYQIKEHGEQIDELDNKVTGIEKNCVGEKIALANLDTKFDGLLAQMTLIATSTKDSMTLIKYVVTVLVVIIVACLGVLGVKVALPGAGV